MAAQYKQQTTGAEPAKKITNKAALLAKLGWSKTTFQRNVRPLYDLYPRLRYAKALVEADVERIMEFLNARLGVDIQA